MFQEPQGQEPQGAVPPPAAPPITPPRIPQQPDLPPAQMGEDAPPALGGLMHPEGRPAPPPWSGWVPPPRLPSDPAEAQAVLDQMRVEFRNAQERYYHQQDLEQMQRIQEAPGQAQQVIDSIRDNPDLDHQEAIDQIRDYLPPSLAGHVQQTQSRVKQLRGVRTRFEDQFREQLRKQHTKDVKPAPGPEREDYDRGLQERQGLEQQRDELMARMRKAGPGQPDYIAAYNELDQVNRRLSQIRSSTEAPIGV